MSRTSDAATQAALRRAVEEAIPRLMPEFLPGQRWFGGKGRAIRDVTLHDLAWLPSPEPAALAIAQVAYGEGAPDRYVLLLSWAAEPRPGSTLGRSDGPEGRPWLIEAAGERAVAAALLRGLCDAGAIRTVGGGRLSYADVDRDAAERLMPETLAAGDVKLLGAEQSNTTFRVGRRHVFKMFRRLEEGENPEAEVTRFLSRSTSFRGAPGLRGSVAHEAPGSPPGTIGVLEDWVENRGDGWSHALRLLGSAEGETVAPEVVRDLELLGGVTAAFHAALASSRSEADFAPQRFTEADRAASVAALRRRVAGTMARLRAAREGLPDAVRTVADRCLAVTESLASWSPPPVGEVGSRFEAIRIHGDYHLGQTLRTDAGFVVIDFEGEPVVSRAERRRKQPALRDVAGMLRSFDYAVAAAGIERNREKVIREMRRAFLAAYGEGIARAPAPVAPADPAASDAWIRFYEVSKAIYEVEYELDHRPAWLGIPLGGIERLLAAESARRSRS
jgi:maltose alpha-D-glucosyltransferase/alpha-amylase